MKGLKRISALLALTFVFSVPAASVVVNADAASSGTGYTKAEDVEYKKTGKTIHNWGAREETCTFLSTYAQDFYVGDYTYETLSQKAGGTKQSDAHKSELYKALHDMMEAEHTFFTYYNGSKNVRDYYKYADCVQNDTTQVSLIYRGTLTSSVWNQGNVWNQEHMWPQSKLSTDQQIGDIMHLRPSNPSENSQRGNSAYGEGDSYYDPNEEGQNVRGDCARTMLYMYVRWELSGKMWGSSGVMESADILLKWMKEDPVDTWEMGRNDAVQSVTGTRNVFVDYPEYAWLLFGKEVPKSMDTPSGVVKNQMETCTHSFGDWVVIREATETEEGLRTRSCINCGVVERERIPKLEVEDEQSSNDDSSTNDEQNSNVDSSTNNEQTSSVEDENSSEVGCNASIGISAISLTMLIGVGLMMKKKEND